MEKKLKRSQALYILEAALEYLIAIVVGGSYLATLAISPLVTLIQRNGNQVLGIPLYAQQVTSLISILFIVLSILYVRFAILNQPKQALKKE